MLLSFVGGGFGDAYVPSKLIVATEAAATAENLKSSEFMFRLGFADYLVEACCDVTLALIFYVLLKPVRRYVSACCSGQPTLARRDFQPTCPFAEDGAP